MIVIGGAIAGVLIGGFQAKRRKGNRKDILHYAAIYGVALAILGLFITLILHRSVA